MANFEAASIAPIVGLRPAVLIETQPQVSEPSSGSFAALLDGATAALQRADASAATLAATGGGVAEAAVARAKADVILEVAAIAASRVSNAISTILQTQV